MNGAYLALRHPRRAYPAIKAFVTNLSLAMHSELRRSDVHLAAIHRPAVRTSFSVAGKADLTSTREAVRGGAVDVCVA